MILRNGFSPGHLKSYKQMHKLIGDTKKITSEDIKHDEVEIPLDIKPEKKMIGIIDLGIEGPRNLLSEFGKS